MTEPEMVLLRKLAYGPIDCYDIHKARPLVGQLIDEIKQQQEAFGIEHGSLIARYQALRTAYANLQQINESLIARVAAQSDLLSKKAEKETPNEPARDPADAAGNPPAHPA